MGSSHWTAAPAGVVLYLIETSTTDPLKETNIVPHTHNTLVVLLLYLCCFPEGMVIVNDAPNVLHTECTGPITY